MAIETALMCCLAYTPSPTRYCIDSRQPVNQGGSTMRPSKASRLPAWITAVTLLAVSSAARAASPEALPQTRLIDWPEEDLSGRMMDGAHQFVERKIAEAVRNRIEFWKFDPSNMMAWREEANPELLRRAIGAVDPLLA